MADEHPPDESVRDDAGSSLLARLVAECLDRVADEGPSAVEAFCQEHAEHAEAIRSRMEALHQMGLLDITPSDQSEYPEELGPFRLLRRLGSGGMGVVYLAEQRPLGRTVALKLMRPDQMFFQGSRQRFQREVMAVARLHHPGIVAVHTAGEEGGIPFFAMEYVRGCSLVDALQALRPRQPADLSASTLLRVVGECSPPEEGDDESVELTDKAWTDVCLRLVLQVAEALAHAHQKGIHHRDIKPSNIMVTHAGRAQLLDFGLASASDTSRLTRSGSQLGSLPYMAPESLEGGSAANGAAADVYSLGVTLYEMLTLHCPFLDENPSVTIRKVLQGEPDPVRLRHPSVSWAAETVCGKAMDRDPTRRYVSAEEFAQDLRNVLENRPILARRPGALLRMQRWGRRHPARAVAMVAGVLLLAASLTYGLLQRSSNRALTEASREKDQALVEKDLALGELKAKNEELDTALKEVDRSFGRVVNAGIKMLTRVSSDILENVPLSDSVRLSLLNEAQQLALELQRDEPDDPRLRYEMSRTLSLLGKFYGDMGDFSKGDAQIRQSVAMLERLVTEQPDHLRYQMALVRSWHQLGTSLIFRGKHAYSAEAFQAGGAIGLKVLNELEEADTPAEMWAELRAVTAMNLQGAGAALGFLERMDEANRAFLEAREQLSHLDFQLHRDEQETLAACCANHSTVLLALGQHEQAKEALRQAIAEYQDMVRKQPGNAGNRTNLGKCMEFLAGFLPEGDPEALEMSTQAVEHLRIARRDSPGSSEAAQGLASALNRLGKEHKDLEQYTEAKVPLEESIELLQQLRRGQRAGSLELLVTAQTRLAECLIATEESPAAEEIYLEAIAIADPWVGDPEADLARCSHAVMVLESYARFLLGEGLPDDAAPHSHRALEESRREFEARPGDHRFIAQLSETAILTSQIERELLAHAASHEVLESVVEAPLTDAELLQAAGVLSGCIGLAEEDPDLDDEQREAVVRRYVATTIALLERLRDRSVLSTDGAMEGEEFDALCSQSDFRDWRFRR